jgi:nicotinate-nucleotide adenylyltransferase
VHLAVLGGTFDPPHNGHLALCLFARELLEIDRIIISVSNNPFKQHGRGAVDSHRKRMAELLSFEINLTGSDSEVSGWELEKRHPSYTVDLIRNLRQCHPSDRLTLLLGEDSFRELPLWKEPEILFSLCDIVVFRRAAVAAVEKTLISETKESIKFIDFASEISSSELRKLVSAGQSISRLTPHSMNQYIAAHALYL